MHLRGGDELNYQVVIMDDVHPLKNGTIRSLLEKSTCALCNVRLALTQDKMFDLHFTFIYNRSLV